MCNSDLQEFLKFPWKRDKQEDEEEQGVDGAAQEKKQTVGIYQETTKRERLKCGSSHASKPQHGGWWSHVLLVYWHLQY